MKKRLTTFISAVFVLLAMMASTGMALGQTGEVETFTFSELGYENAADVTTVTGDYVTLTFDQGDGTNSPKYYSSGSAVRMYMNNTLEVVLNGSGTITAIDFTFVSPSYQGSLQNWAGSETSVAFTNTASSQARIQEITVTFSNGGSTKLPCDLALTNAPVALTFDLYDNGEDQVISYTTSSTGAISVVESNYIDTDIDEVGKTITITPVIVTNGVQTITINQAADDNYYAGSTTFTVTITDSTPFEGGDVTFDATVDMGTSPLVKNGVTFACSNGVLNNGSEYRLYKNSVTTFSVGDGYSITQIAFTCTSSNAASGFAEQDGWTIDGDNGTWTGNAESVSFTASGAQVRATEIVVTVTPPSTDPYITASNVDLEYSATNGVIEYTIENVPAQGGNLTAEVTEGNWITLGTVGTTVPFTCSANVSASERTATVTLTYTYGDNETATKDVTVTQAGNPDVTMTIAAARAQGEGNVVTKGVITSITGSNNKTAYIQDETAAIVVYGNFTAAVGDEIKVSGTLSDYSGLLEIINPQVTVLSSNNPVLPQLMTIAEVVASTNQGWYVRIEEATVTVINGQNTTIAQGENTIVVRGISGVEYAVNDVISLNGNIGYFNGNQIANPQNVEVQVNPDPSIAVTPATINAPAEGAEGTLAINYENIPDLIAFDIQFCDANGEELEGDDPDWIYAEITEQTGDVDYVVTYIIDANEGEARNAYFKVYTFIGDELEETVYSNLITINQDEYVAPTYAELPFEFDGGRADIEGTDGLYQEGLGTDYNNSPKLKFDHTSDYLLLQFLEEPGKLTFDIKGNGFSEGTFTVQISEDGVTFEDLETYSELGAVQHETFNNLGENVRYIKWIYTEKVNGNVALGNIKLSQPTQPYDLTVEPYENLEIFTFVGGDESEVALEGPGTIQVYDGEEVMLSITANEGYEIQSLMVDGEEHVNDIDEAETYTFTMPSHNVTISATAVEIVPPTPFEPVTYRLASTIESGRSYIITNEVMDGEAYAMGAQNPNNRTAVTINVNGTVATVETEDVYEFVIEGPDENGLYTIYDERTPGYLYAASSSSNWLRTQAENDDNGRWAITFNAEGYAEIQATESSNRNVMQYNSGSNLFSCYGSNSQSPVYLYVRDENPTVSQTLELTEGWNWISLYVEGEDAIATLQMLENALGENATQITSADFFTEYAEEWWGELDEVGITNDQTYMILATQDCTVTVEGMLTDPASIEITLNPGWNWIGFPSANEMDVDAALANLEAADGDLFANADDFLEYDGGWFGNFESLLPGQGFMYYNSTDEVKTFVIGIIPMKNNTGK